MRKFLLLVIILISVFSAVSAQEKVAVKKANNHSYVCTVDDAFVTIRNQNSKYWGVDPEYNPEAGTMPLPKFVLEDEAGLWDFIGKNFMPYVKKEQMVFGKNLCFDFCFNIEGTIEEVSMFYPKEIEVPITVIEQLEDYIIHQCRIQFKPNAVVKGAKYISYFIDYPLKNLDKFRDISE